MRRSFLFLSALALGLCVPGGAFAQDSDASQSDRVQSLVQPSIVYLETTYSAKVKDTNPEFSGVMFNGEPISATGRCTGFFVNPTGYVATAGHCVLVSDENKDWIIAAAAERAVQEGQFSKDATEEAVNDYVSKWFAIGGPVTMEYHVAYATTSKTISSEESVTARRVGYRPFEQGDIGLLKFETGGVEMPGLELARSPDVRVGTPIVAVGFPGSVDDVTDEDYNPSFTAGDVQRIGTTGGGQVAVYQHGAAVSGGMSGGPVVDADGHVVGVTSFGINGETEAFNYATPAANSPRSPRRQGRR